MRVARRRTPGLLLAALLGLAAPLAAQQGTLTGRVINAATGQPLEGAQISVVGTEQGGLSDASGRYTLQLTSGTYSLVVEYIGFATRRFDGIRISAGQTTTQDLRLPVSAVSLGDVTVTVARGSTPEARSSQTTVTVGELQIEEKIVNTPADYLKGVTGVDIVSYGLQGNNVVVRGFNNIFSGALHMLTDYRLAGVPSLRVNLMHFIPSNQEDLERMEVVLGPGSALYGPNTANGIVHMITRSPLSEQGTTLTLGGGERGTLQGSFRSAFLLGENLGFKVSGQYFQGDDWEFDDPTEVANRASADANPTLCLQDKGLRGITGAAAQEACDRIGIRDYDIRRFGLEARADWRIADNATLVTTYGRNQSSGVELTGLGAGQTVDWVYEFYQARLNVDRFFAQVYVNTSDAADSYLLNTGVPLVDQSKLLVGQLQHGFDLGDGKQDFTYGLDFLGTRPETNGQINGVYEDSDEMNEWGVYLQSRTALSDKLDLILAGRMDNHSILKENVYSPRAGLVFRPTEEHSLRVSYNQAYSSPSSLNYFLDISNGFAPGLSSLGFGLRAFGTGRDGWSLQNADGTLKGFTSPFNPGGRGMLLPMAAATQFWGATIQVLQAQLAAGALPAELAPLLGVLAGLSPTAGDISNMLFHPIDGWLVPESQANLPAVPSIAESNTETFELGWTGTIENRVKITADVYRTTKNDFVSPLLVQTPLVTFNGQDVGAFITGPIVQALTQQYMAAGLPQDQAFQMAQQDAATIVPQLAAGIAGVPVGVVGSDELSGGSELIVTYRNVGDLTLWGSDFALQWFLNDNWVLDGTYSFVSDDLFDIEDGSPIALNAPKHKGSVGLAFRDPEAGFNAQARVRFNSAFPAISAGFDGDVPSSQVVDFGMGYRVPNSGATLQMSISNIFNQAYRSFVGVPEIGRLAMLKVKYDLF